MNKTKISLNIKISENNTVIFFLFLSITSVCIWNEEKLMLQLIAKQKMVYYLSR